MAELAAKKSLTRKGGRLLIYFFIAAFTVIGALFGVYRLFVSEAFADRGVSENVLPKVFTAPTPTVDLNYFNSRFSCEAKSRVIDLPPNSVGMFPLFLANTQNTCNKAADFVGVERFLDAFLYGEAGIANPATAKSKETPFLTHHPGLFRLRKLAKAGDGQLDRSNSFFWWMFPLPIATPSRGFSYALFWGDFLELQRVAARRQLDFVALFAEGIDLLLQLNGFTQKDSEKSTRRFNEQDHVIVKAFMSLQCVKSYTSDARLLPIEQSLKSFMQAHVIRYPTDYQCTQSL